MNKLVDDISVELPCENCGRKSEKTVGWIKSHDEFTCTCGTVISLERDDVLNAIGNAAGRKFAKFIKAVNKTIK